MICLEKLAWQREILEGTKRMLVTERTNAEHKNIPTLRQIIAQVDAAIVINRELVNENPQDHGCKVRNAYEESRAKADKSFPA